jgi:hypothetical protein
VPPADLRAEVAAAVVAVGPTAGGKSTRLGELGYGAGRRRIDSDVFTLMLIEHDLHRGYLALPADMADLALPDRGAVMPLEVSGLYHYASTVLADKAQEICMAVRQNVIVEGTLSWHGLVPQLVGDLVTHGYETLDVVLVEVPLVTALERALLCWWAERQVGGATRGPTGATNGFRSKHRYRDRQQIDGNGGDI